MLIVIFGTSVFQIRVVLCTTSFFMTQFWFAHVGLCTSFIMTQF